MPLFVLLIGPSGVGKSTIIRELLEKDLRFAYVTPYMDRPLRPKETDKNSVKPEIFDKMIEEGKFIAVNIHFNYRYGTPRETIMNILSKERIPVLDMQLTGVNTLREYNKILLKIYIVTPSINILKERLIKENRRNRFYEGKKEIEFLTKRGYKDEHIDFVVINENITKSVKEIQSLVNKKL